MRTYNGLHSVSADYAYPSPDSAVTQKTATVVPEQVFFPMLSYVHLYTLALIFQCGKCR